MCLNEDVSVRPLIRDVVTALSFLGDGTDAIELIDSPTETSSSLSFSDMNKQTNASIGEREREVAEATEWGMTARTSAMSRSMR